MEIRPFDDIGAALALAQLYAERPVDNPVDSEPVSASPIRSRRSCHRPLPTGCGPAQGSPRSTPVLPMPNLSPADFADPAPAQHDAASSAA